MQRYNKFLIYANFATRKVIKIEKRTKWKGLSESKKSKAKGNRPDERFPVYAAQFMVSAKRLVCKARLSHLLALDGVDLIAAEDVDLVVMKDFDGFVGVYMYILDGLWTICRRESS